MEAPPSSSHGWYCFNTSWTRSGLRENGPINCGDVPNETTAVSCCAPPLIASTIAGKPLMLSCCSSAEREHCTSTTSESALASAASSMCTVCRMPLSLTTNWLAFRPYSTPPLASCTSVGTSTRFDCTVIVDVCGSCVAVSGVCAAAPAAIINPNESSQPLITSPLHSTHCRFQSTLRIRHFRYRVSASVSTSGWSGAAARVSSNCTRRPTSFAAAVTTSVKSESETWCEHEHVTSVPPSWSNRMARRFNSL